MKTAFFGDYFGLSLLYRSVFACFSCKLTAFSAFLSIGRHLFSEKSEEFLPIVAENYVIFSCFGHSSEEKLPASILHQKIFFRFCACAMPKIKKADHLRPYRQSAVIVYLYQMLNASIFFAIKNLFAFSIPSLHSTFRIYCNARCRWLVSLR